MSKLCTVFDRAMGMRNCTFLLIALAVLMHVESSANPFVPEPWAGSAFAEDTQMNEWLEECRRMRADLSDAFSRPMRIQPTPAEGEGDRRSPHALEWKGVPVPLPKGRYDTVVLIPESIASIRGPEVSIIFSRVDLTTHFHELAGLYELSGHALSGQRLIDWLVRGIEMSAEDLRCVPESRTEDVVHVVHKIAIGVLVLADSDTKMMTTSDGARNALVLGERSRQGERVHIQYLVQSPRVDRIELIHVNYHLDWQGGIVEAMNSFATSRSASRDAFGDGIPEIVRAILDERYDEAGTLARARGMNVQVGLK